MKHSEAITLVKDTFDSKYSTKKFTRFVSNLFKGELKLIDESREGQLVIEAFQTFIQSYKIIGNYLDAEGIALDVLEVTLHREGSLERARTAQRNFVADYLKINGKEAALVAFLSPDHSDWRFSLVKLEYSLELKEGKLTTEEELTPAKRWSFLIGRHEGSHTVQRRFVSLIEDDEKPLLSELEESFNIESVTDEFFKKYCELFFKMKESLDTLLDNDPDIKNDFESKELTTVDFAKKTLGQMAFLYFLQKKGWFGVASGKPWGTGPKDFIRQLFNRREKYGQNFFDDILEPLFYEALAQDRGEEAIYPRLNNCRMPFLNGGLFEPMNGYSWETTHIIIPDELFSNSNKTIEGDEGDGILDIFERYNFTVNESEPLEKEVAVDPEMLGKVFENLLEVKDRKSKGTFYTPREIVHNMCQECLINYLFKQMDKNIPREDIETLIRNGSQIIQNDALVIEKGEKDLYRYMLPENIRSDAEQLDKALAEIKVCDPAVGSGAFPLGMLNEIVQARQALTVHIKRNLSAFDLKLHSISHSLYGVDLDPGAVEIAKLRLWLALVVEENEPHPLPNLEHKIMQGNSLISEYDGVKLFDDSFLEQSNYIEQELVHIEKRLSEAQKEYFSLHSKDELSAVKKVEIERDIRALTKRKKSIISPDEKLIQELNIFDAPAKYQNEQLKAEQLQYKIEQYISESQRSKKQKLKSEIEQLKWELIEASCREQGQIKKLQEIKQLRKKNIKPFFVWKLEFSDVFKEKGGFDIVIGNPPYLKIQNIEADQAAHLKSIYQSATGKFDIYILFVELSFLLVNPNGETCYIHPHRFITADYGKKFKKFLEDKRGLKKALIFDDQQMFDTATTYTGIFYYTNQNTSISYTRPQNENLNNLVFDENSYDETVGLWDFIEGGKNSKSLLSKCRTQTNRVGDIFEGIYQGIVTTGDAIFILEKLSENMNTGITRCFSKRLNEEIELESYVLKDTLKGENIRRYAECSSDLVVIYPHFQDKNGKTQPFTEEEMKNDFPLTYNYLNNFKDELTERKIKYKTNPKFWYSLHRSRQMDIFEAPKILTPQLQNRPSFTFDKNCWYPDAGGYSLILKDKPKNTEQLYLSYLAILNSRLFMFYIEKTSNMYNNAYYYFKTKNIEGFTIPTLSDDNITLLANYAERLIVLYKDEKLNLNEISDVTSKLDYLIFNLYMLETTETDLLIN